MHLIFQNEIQKISNEQDKEKALDNTWQEKQNQPLQFQSNPKELTY